MLWFMRTYGSSKDGKKETGAEDDIDEQALDLNRLQIAHTNIP